MGASGPPQMLKSMALALKLEIVYHTQLCNVNFVVAAADFVFIYL